MAGELPSGPGADTGMHACAHVLLITPEASSHSSHSSEAYDFLTIHPCALRRDCLTSYLLVLLVAAAGLVLLEALAVLRAHYVSNGSRQ